MQIIPFKEPSQWQEQIELSGTIFILSFAWNALNEFWMMDIYDQDSNPLILGIKIVPNYNLTARYAVQGMPEGDILCINFVNSNDEISRYDMSQKFELVYFDLGELDAI